MRVFHMHPRLTLRATSGIVAVVAILIWGGVMASRLYRAAAYHQARAETHDIEFQHHRENQEGLHAEVLRLATDIDRVTQNAINVDLDELKHTLKRFQRQALFEARMADYQLQLKQKYAYAASHPWIKVAPDPEAPPRLEPEPDDG
jgi:hypothetical protein